MALVCNKITKIANLFRNNLKNKLNSFTKLEDKLSIFQPFNNNLNKVNLSNLLHQYQNFKHCNLYEETQLETLLVENIKTSLDSPKENYGNDSIITALRNPSNQNKEILIKIIRLMNNHSEIFKKHDLESTIKILSSPKFYQIKTEVSKELNFFKKNPKSKILRTTELENKGGNKFGINVDIENNIIVLSDKFNENRHIVFVELTHNNHTSNSLYHSLIKTMTPSVILLEQEPYLDKNLNKFDKFEDLDIFKEFIKENFDSNLEIKNNFVFNNDTQSIGEIESIILSSLVSKKSLNFNQDLNKKVILFDVPYHNYFQSFLHSCIKNENLNSIEKLQNVKNKISIINMMEIIHWLSVQETLGCKNCASFLNKRDVNWYTLHLEFLINKKSLPNYNYINNYKIKKIVENVNNTKENIMIFSSNTRDLVENFLDYSLNNSLTNSGIETVLEFEDYFKLTDFNNNFNLEALSLGLHLKENYKKFYKNLPFKIEGNNQYNCKTGLNNLRTAVSKDFDQFYCNDNDMNKLSDDLKVVNLEGKESEQNFEISYTNENSSVPKKKSFVIKNSKTSFMKDKISSNAKIVKCEPFDYLESIVKFKKEMEDILLEQNNLI